MTAKPRIDSSMATAIARPDDALWQINKIEAEESLAELTRQAWHVVEPGRPLVWGKPLDAIIEHLEAVTAGDITYLIINVPPGCMKSLLVRVFWPVWEWISNPYLKYLGYSYDDSLSVRDNLRAKRIIESDWFRARWADRVTLTSDQHAKKHFENQATGWMRTGTILGGATGHRGDRAVLDDPNNVKKVESAASRYDTNHFLAEVLPSRVNDLGISPMICVQQRTHVEDATGFLLEAWSDPVHLCLPMEHERDRTCVTITGFRDWREEEGELLWPERFPQEAVDGLKETFRTFGGTYAEAGQLQQRPAPREGGLFKVDQLEIVDLVPGGVVEHVLRYWDKAGTEGGSGAYTAGVKMGFLTDGRVIILDVIRFRHSVGKREQLIQATAEADGEEVDGWMEQEPGSGGKDSVIESIRGLQGYNYRADKVNDGDKERRAEPFAAQVEIGNVVMLRGQWNKEYIEELRSFPNGKFKDQADASSGGYNKLAKKRRRPKPRLSLTGDTDQAPVATLR